MAESFKFIVTHPNTCSTACGKITITSTGGATGKTGKYSIDGGVESTPSAFPLVLQGLCPGTYTVKVTSIDTGNSATAPLTLVDCSILWNWWWFVFAVFVILLIVAVVFYMVKGYRKGGGGESSSRSGSVRRR